MIRFPKAGAIFGLTATLSATAVHSGPFCPEMADTAPGFIAMLGDIADEAYRNAMANGIDLESLISQGTSAASKLSVLMDSGILDDGAVRVVGAAGKALADASQQTIEPVGMFGLLGALRDPDTQRALGFLLNVGSNLGKELK